MKRLGLVPALFAMSLTAQQPPEVGGTLAAIKQGPTWVKIHPLAASLGASTLSTASKARFSEEIDALIHAVLEARSERGKARPSLRIPESTPEDLARRTGLSPVLCEALLGWARTTMVLQKEDRIAPEVITAIQVLPDLSSNPRKRRLDAAASPKDIPPLRVDDLSSCKAFLHDLMRADSAGGSAKVGQAPVANEENARYTKEQQEFSSNLAARIDKAVAEGKKDQVAAAFDRFNKHAKSLPGGTNGRILLLFLSDVLDVESAARLKEVVRKAKAIDHINPISRYALLTTPAIQGGVRFVMTIFEEATGQAVPLAYTYLGKAELAKSDLPESLLGIGDETIKRLKTQHETMLNIAESHRLDARSAAADAESAQYRAISARHKKLTRLMNEFRLMMKPFADLVSKYTVQGDTSVKPDIDRLIEDYRRWLPQYSQEPQQEQDEELNKTIKAVDTLIAQYKAIEQSRKRP